MFVRSVSLNSVLLVVTSSVSLATANSWFVDAEEWVKLSVLHESTVALDVGSSVDWEIDGSSIKLKLVSVTAVAYDFLIPALVSATITLDTNDLATLDEEIVDSSNMLDSWLVVYDTVVAGEDETYVAIVFLVADVKLSKLLLDPSETSSSVFVAKGTTDDESVVTNDC